MEIFKKLVNNLSSLINTEPNLDSKSKPESKPKSDSKTISTYMGKKQADIPPDYSAYVSVHPYDDIYRVSLEKHIFKRFPKISEEYAKAMKNYHDIKSLNLDTPNYTESFAHLNKAFYMIVKRLCISSGIDCKNNGLYSMSESLPKAGFNQEQMNVVYGILHMIDTHKNESDIVTEHDIKTHFVSLGLIIKIFKASENGEMINDIPCSFASMRAKAKNSDEISKNPNAARKAKNAAIKESFSRAKRLNKENRPKKAAGMLEKTVSLSIEKQCMDNNINFTSKDTPTELLNVLSNLNVITPAFKETADKVLSYAAMLKSGKTPEKNRVQSLITSTGSTIVHATCDNAQTPNVKKIMYPSFKEMEEKSQAYDYDLNKEYPQLSMFIKTAQKRIMHGEYKEALVQYRNSLEFMVNTLCKKYGIDFDSKINLFDKIELLHTKNIITKNQLSLMHQARSLGNDGAHYNLDTISENDARRESDLITKIFDIFKEITVPLNGVKNTPMLDPDFYSNSRKYYGLWPYETRAEALLNDMNYVRLKRRADNGNIEAMLDLATVFLPQPNKMKWGYDHLILSPNFESNGYKTLYNPFDSRYYYWLIQAGKQAYNDWISGKSIPLKYIATALAESIKYMLDSYIYDSFALPLFDDKMNYRTQKQLAEYLFECDFSFDSSTICNFAVMLICMLDEYKDDMVDGSSIISPLNNMSIQEIKCYVYMYNYYTKRNEKVTLDSKLLLDPNDITMTYDSVIFTRKDLFSKFLKLKDYILNQNNKK